MHQKKEDTELCHLLLYLALCAFPSLLLVKLFGGAFSKGQSPEICLWINTKTWKKDSLVIRIAKLQLCSQRKAHTGISDLCGKHHKA